jgi:Predicted aminoglycoside phosphotransferase
MNSKSKLVLSEETIKKLFERAGIPGAENIEPLGAGEYNAVYSADAGGKYYAIKIAPKDTDSSLAYEKDLMSSEILFYGLMKKAGIRVPAIYYSDTDKSAIPSSYFIMERLRGDDLGRARLTPGEKKEAQKKLAELAARLHSIKGEKFGYVQNALYGDWHSALVSMIKNLLSDAARLGKKSPRGNKLLAFVEKNGAAFEGVEPRLVNFDIWPPNIFVLREEGSFDLAWIDPERCFFGDRIADFVCLEFTKLSLDDKLESLKNYNAAADMPIIVDDKAQIRYYSMLGYLGLVMEVEKYARYTPARFGWWRNVLVSKMLFGKAFKALANFKNNYE